MPTITQDLLLILLGFLVGSFGTLIGAGGGFILVPVLVLLYPDIKPESVTAISLAVVFLNATSGSIAYARMKRIDYKTGLIFAAATVPGSIFGATATSYVSKHLFNMILGGLLIAIAIFLLVRPQEGGYSKKVNKGGVIKRTLVDGKGHTFSYEFNIWTGIIISFLVGFLSSFLGIGGGIIHVPALVSLLAFPVYIATATSHFILAIMALVGTIVHMINGTFWENWQMSVFIGIGVVFGAQVGARLSHKVKSKYILYFLSFALLIVGVRLLFTHK